MFAQKEFNFKLNKIIFTNIQFFDINEEKRFHDRLIQFIKDLCV